MKDLVEYIVKQLVSNPDKVTVTEETSVEGIMLVLDVAPEDMGLIIGKGGQTIKSIRRLLTVKAIADQVRVNLRLNEQVLPTGEELPKTEEESSPKGDETPETKEEEPTSAETSVDSVKVE